MTCKLMGGDKAIYELEYYSPGGGFYEWKGDAPPKKGQPKYPYATMKELRQHAEQNNLSIAQVIMANEVAVSGKTAEHEQAAEHAQWCAHTRGQFAAKTSDSLNSFRTTG